MLPLHMSEQLLFGIGELAIIRSFLVVYYYGWFREPDYGTVVLVTIVGTLVVGLTFGILLGGIWKRISLGVWALLAVSEMHHIVETIHAGHYTSGTLTAIPYMIFGLLLLRAVVRN
jgi:hypothetical protein